MFFSVPIYFLIRERVVKTALAIILTTMSTNGQLVQLGLTKAELRLTLTAFIMEGKLIQGNYKCPQA